jgi:hypothetical protein
MMSGSCDDDVCPVVVVVVLRPGGIYMGMVAKILTCLL